jgi:hypothetical protein
MNYKYYITALFFINSFSLHASDTLIKRSSVKEMKVTYAQTTGNVDLIQKERQKLIDHNNHEQFKQDIKIIQEWNSQEDGNNAGSAVGRIAEKIETFKTLSSYKKFQGLDLSMILTRCSTFKHYSNRPAGGVSILQTILIALAPHNESAFNFYSTIYSKTIVPKQCIGKPYQFTADATADAQEIIKIITPPIPTSVPNQISQQPELPTPGAREQKQIEEFIDSPQDQEKTDEHELTNTPDQAEQDLMPSPAADNKEEVENEQHKPEPTPPQEQPKATDAPKHKDEKVASTSFYTKLFFGLGSLGTLLLALYCSNRYDKEILINFFNNPQYALTYLRAIVSKMAI